QNRKRWPRTVISRLIIATRRLDCSRATANRFPASLKSLRAKWHTMLSFLLTVRWLRFPSRAPRSCKSTGDFPACLVNIKRHTRSRKAIHVPKKYLVAPSLDRARDHGIHHRDGRNGDHPRISHGTGPHAESGVDDRAGPGRTPVGRGRAPGAGRGDGAAR